MPSLRVRQGCFRILDAHDNVETLLSSGTEDYFGGTYYFNKVCTGTKFFAKKRFLMSQMKSIIFNQFVKTGSGRTKETVEGNKKGVSAGRLSERALGSDARLLRHAGRMRGKSHHLLGVPPPRRRSARRARA